MIDECDYRLPHKQQDKPKPKADPSTLAYLEGLGWRPHGVEW
jgi:hypothetical protein